jgi:hypothetical protein
MGSASHRYPLVLKPTPRLLPLDRTRRGVRREPRGPALLSLPKYCAAIYPVHTLVLGAFPLPRAGLRKQIAYPGKQAYHGLS